MSLIERYQRANFLSLRDKLKPWMCDECKKAYDEKYKRTDDDGVVSYVPRWCREPEMGTCEKCKENIKWNEEYIHTHTFITDSDFGCYHDSDHDLFKSTKLRMPGEENINLYYGIELEIEFDDYYVNVFDRNDDDDEGYYYDEDDGEETTYEIDEILKEFTAITDGMFVYEKDGSLANGVEMISRPMSYKFLTSPETVEKLKNGLEYLREHHAYAFQPNTNGMHIHLSRDFFGECGSNEEYRNLKNFDWFFQKFQPEFEKLAGRKYGSYCGSKTDKMKRRLKDTYYLRVDKNSKVKMEKGEEVPTNDHSYAVILSGNTIEARIFNSTTDYKTVLANVEMVRNLAHAARNGDNVGMSLHKLLHTVPNLYLDEHIKNIRNKEKSTGNKFNLQKKNTNEVDIVF